MTNEERAADLSAQFADGKDLGVPRKEVACELHRFKRSTSNAEL